MTVSIKLGWQVTNHSREVLVEFIGTFTMVFAGTGAVVVNQISQGALTHLGISFVFGSCSPRIGGWGADRQD